MKVNEPTEVGVRGLGVLDMGLVLDNEASNVVNQVGYVCLTKVGSFMKIGLYYLRYIW